MLKKKVILFLLPVFLLVPGILAQQQDFNYVISNSEDWRDVYSTMLYAYITGKTGDFLVSEKHSLSILGGIDKRNQIMIVSSKTTPFVIGYESMMQGQGFATAKEFSYDNVNLELGKLANTRNFIIMGDSYGYNAIAVAPYAALKKSWVLFANRRNIAEIENFLDSRAKDEIILYGYVDREVKNAISKYNPIIINNGDRFNDNIQIVKRYLVSKPTKQVVLTNGEFIEKEIMSGNSPVLFTGDQNVPDQIRDYLKTSGIEVGVLIGNNLVGAATNIRRTAGISVMVKFARSARNPTGSITQVEGLDIFYLPVPKLDLKLVSVKYNKATSRLEVTYKSDSNIPVYIKGTITLIYGTSQIKVGDIEGIFIAPNDYKTIVYTGINITSDSIKAQVFTLFGESKSSLEKILQQEIDVKIVDVIDKCEIKINSITYKTYKKAFSVDVSNLGETECWVDIELPDVIIDKNPTIIGTDGSTHIPANNRKNIEIPSELQEVDLKDNTFVNIIAYYGEREDSLTSILKGKFELNISRFNATYYVFALIATILIIIIFLIFWKRRKKEEDED